MQSTRNFLHNTTWCRFKRLVELQHCGSLRRRAVIQSRSTQCPRCSSSSASTPARGRPETVMNVFDRKAKRVQRDRSAMAEDHQVYDYLKDEFGYRLSDRMCDIKRKFGVAVELGCGKGFVSRNLYSDMVDTLYQCELSAKTLELSEPSPEVPTHKVIMDEEFFPFRDNSLDLVVSNLSLHWVNDLPGCFRQVHAALKNDAVFMGSMFGGDTLYELRVALQLAELEREGGFAPHISPFTDVQDLGNLLTRAGYTMLTIDIDEMAVTYPTIYELMYDLKVACVLAGQYTGLEVLSQGEVSHASAQIATIFSSLIYRYGEENNCSWTRKLLLHRDTMTAAAAIYQTMYGNDKGIPATFQVINFIGWKPDPSQPKAAERGSGEVSLKDLDKINQLTTQIQEVRKEGQDAPLDKLDKELEGVATQYTDPEFPKGKK